MYTKEHPYIAISFIYMGMAYLYVYNLDKASDYLKNALEILNRYFVTRDWPEIGTYSSLMNSKKNKDLTYNNPFQNLLNFFFISPNYSNENYLPADT